MARASTEIGERHLVTASDFRIHLMNLGGEPIWWKPFWCVCIQKRSIDLLRCCPQYSVETDRACRVGSHSVWFRRFRYYYERQRWLRTKASQCKNVGGTGVDRRA